MKRTRKANAAFTYDREDLKSLFQRSFQQQIKNTPTSEKDVELSAGKNLDPKALRCVCVAVSIAYKVVSLIQSIRISYYLQSKYLVIHFRLLYYTWLRSCPRFPTKNEC